MLNLLRHNTLTKVRVGLTLLSSNKIKGCFVKMKQPFSRTKQRFRKSKQPLRKK
ncbi:MAG: hypothetical protein LBL74_03095 [Bacteroidales bacterium]|nr:hypothetical protein [Bacteroidales bacterium]